MRKEFNQKNYLVRWGLIVGFITFFLLSFSIITIDFQFVRDPDVVPDWHFRAVLFLGAAFLTVLVVRRTIYFLANYLNHVYMRRFSEIKDLGAFQETRSREFNPGKKAKHGVLFLHGFTLSAQEFENILVLLEQAGIPYYAPNIEGFGINSTDILHVTRYQDWVRSVLEAYDALTLIAEEISIVGHSMGALLAIFVAQQKRVNKLILSAPGLYCTKGDLIYKRILQLPIFSSTFVWLIPYLPKTIRFGRKTISDTLDPSLAGHAFQYLAVPVFSIKQLFLAQEAAKKDIANLRCQEMVVLYGKYDSTVDIDKTVNFLQRNLKPFTLYCFERSAHNLFEDYDRKEFIELVYQLLEPLKPHHYSEAVC